MWVCIVTTAFPRWKNDSRAPFIFEAAKSLANHGLKIKVIASHSPGSKTREIIDNIEIIRPRYLPLMWENLHKEPGGIPEAWTTQRIGRFALIPFMLTQTKTVLIETNECDLIHANWTIAGTAALVNYYLNKKPYLITIQGSDIYKAAKLPIVSSITRLILSKSKRIITLSSSLKKRSNEIKYPNEKISVIPNGVNTNFFHPINSKRSQIIFFAESLVKRKGVEFLIRSMPKIIDQNNSIRLVIAGEGNERANLKKLVTNLR